MRRNDESKQEKYFIVLVTVRTILIYFINYIYIITFDCKRDIYIIIIKHLFNFSNSTDIECGESYFRVLLPANPDSLTVHISWLYHQNSSKTHNYSITR